MDKRKPGSVLKRAFFNQYNYILLGGSAMYALATGSWLPAVMGVGAEVLWLVVGADTGAFHKWVGKQEAREEQERLAAETTALLKTLDQDYAARHRALADVAYEIEQLARENKGLEAVLLKDEMSKLGQLLSSFLKMAAAHQRLARYMRDSPPGDVERDIARAQRSLKTEQDARVQASLKQALSLAQKRLRQHQEIEGAWKALSVQMETVEKSFDYLKSHILGIGTREELAAELDNLVDGVSSVAEIEASTDELMRELRVSAAGRGGAVRQS
jgi:hypothetical protein